MVAINWSCKVILTFITAASSTELVPERFLRPRDFNHHPFTDVGIPASLKQTPRIPQVHPYAILSKKRPREGRQFPHQDVVLYPNPHPSVLPKKHLETNEIDGDNYDDPYVHIPKNYAFSYSVKDHQSGDDFSHSQAHNGKATRGQYRVKLPDGRTQVVSYTADHKGYRADVQYEDDHLAKPIPKPSYYQQNIPETPTALPHHVPNSIHKFHNPPVTEEPAQHEPVQYRFVSRYNIEPSNYLTNPTTSEPRQYVSSTPLYLIRSTPAPQYDDYDQERSYVSSTTQSPYANQQYVSSTQSPYANQQYVSSTQSPYANQQYVSSTQSSYANQQYVSSTQSPYANQQYISSTQSPYTDEQYVSSTPQFGDKHRYVSSTPAPTPYIHRTYTGSQNYNDLPSSSASQQVVVTPRSLYGSSAGRDSEFQQRPHILYRVVQPAGR